MLQQMSRTFPCGPTISKDWTTVDEDIGDTLRILTRVFIAGALANSLGVEDDDIGRVAGLQNPAVTQVQNRRWEAGHLADRLFKREQTQIAAVMSQNPRATPVGPRMGSAAEQAVGAHGAPGGPQDVLDVLFANLSFLLIFIYFLFS